MLIHPGYATAQECAKLRQLAAEASVNAWHWRITAPKIYESDTPADFDQTAAAGTRPQEALDEADWWDPAK